MARRRGAALAQFGSDLFMKLLAAQMEQQSQARQFDFQREQSREAREATAAQQLAMQKRDEEQALRQLMLSNPQTAQRLSRTGIGSVGGFNPRDFAPTEDETIGGLMKEIGDVTASQNVPSRESLISRMAGAGFTPQEEDVTTPVGQFRIASGRTLGLLQEAQRRRAILEGKEREAFLGSHPAIRNGVQSIVAPGGDVLNTERTGPEQGTREAETIIAANTPQANRARTQTAFATESGSTNASLDEQVMEGQTKSPFEKKKELALAGTMAAPPTEAQQVRLGSYLQLVPIDAQAKQLEAKGAVLRPGSEMSMSGPVGSAIMEGARFVGLSGMTDLDKQLAIHSENWTTNVTRAYSGVQSRPDELNRFRNIFFANAAEQEKDPTIVATKQRNRTLMLNAIKAGLTDGGYAAGRQFGDMITSGVFHDPENKLDDANYFFRIFDVIDPEVIQGMQDSLMKARAIKGGGIR